MSNRKSGDAPRDVRVKVGEDGSVEIPAAFRDALGIGAGDEVLLCWSDEELRITTMKRRIERTQRVSGSTCSRVSR